MGNQMVLRRLIMARKKGKFFKFCKNPKCEKRFKPSGNYQVYCPNCLEERCRRYSNGKPRKKE